MTLKERIQAQRDHIVNVKSTLRESLISKGVNIEQSPSFKQINDGLLSIQPEVPELTFKEGTVNLSYQGFINDLWGNNIEVFLGTRRVYSWAGAGSGFNTQGDTVASSIQSWIKGKRVSYMYVVRGSTVRITNLYIYGDRPGQYLSSIGAIGFSTITNIYLGVLDVEKVIWANPSFQFQGNLVDIL